MAVNPKNKEFDVRASIIVYKDGEQHKRLTVDNPVFYPTNKRSVVTIQSIPKQEQNIAFVSGLYCKETLGKELWHLKQITKYGSLNPDRSAKYRDALNYFGLTNIKDFIFLLLLRPHISLLLTKVMKLNKVSSELSLTIEGKYGFPIIFYLLLDCALITLLPDSHKIN